jgi:hypothetical protein
MPPVLHCREGAHTIDKHRTVQQPPKASRSRQAIFVITGGADPLTLGLRPVLRSPALGVLYFAVVSSAHELARVRGQMTLGCIRAQGRRPTRVLLRRQAGNGPRRVVEGMVYVWHLSVSGS